MSFTARSIFIQGMFDILIQILLEIEHRILSSKLKYSHFTLTHHDIDLVFAKHCLSIPQSKDLVLSPPSVPRSHIALISGPKK